MCKPGFALEPKINGFKHWFNSVQPGSTSANPVPVQSGQGGFRVVVKNVGVFAEQNSCFL
jgi:hypothetical protein